MTTTTKNDLRSLNEQVSRQQHQIMGVVTKKSNQYQVNDVNLPPISIMGGSN